MAISHSFNKKTCPIISPTIPPYHFFVRFVCCFKRRTLSTIFYSDEIYIAKNNAISKYNKFFLSTYCWSAFILLLCVYVFFSVLFHTSAMMRLQVASYLHICIAFLLAFHQIMGLNKAVHGHTLKITSVLSFRQN